MMNQIKRVVYELKDLRKDYGNHTVLQIGHLEFHPGTIYGIVGSIGSGKSTLLRLLSGNEKETSGSLKYDDDTFKTGWFGKIKPNEDIFLASVDFFHENQNQNIKLPQTSQIYVFTRKSWARGQSQTI